MNKNTILDYVTETPGNTNKAVLSGMLDKISGTKLPSPTPSDNGKVLGVDGGEYKLVEQSGGESGSNSIKILKYADYTGSHGDKGFVKTDAGYSSVFYTFEEVKEFYDSGVILLAYGDSYNSGSISGLMPIDYSAGNPDFGVKSAFVFYYYSKVDDAVVQQTYTLSQL